MSTESNTDGERGGTPHTHRMRMRTLEKGGAVFKALPTIGFLLSFTQGGRGMNVEPVTAIESRRSCDEQAASRSRFAACLYWPSSVHAEKGRDAGLETSAEPDCILYIKQWLNEEDLRSYGR
jgi:hypothetical protein